MPKKEERKALNISANSKIGEIVFYKGGVGRVIDKTGNGLLVSNSTTKVVQEVKV